MKNAGQVKCQCQLALRPIRTVGRHSVQYGVCLRHLRLFLVVGCGHGLFVDGRLAGGYGIHLHQPEPVTLGHRRRFFRPSGCDQRRRWRTGGREQDDQPVRHPERQAIRRARTGTSEPWFPT